MSNQSNENKRVLDQLMPEIEKAYRSIPQYGDIGFKVFFHEGEPVRIEVTGGLSKKLMPKGER